MIFAAAHMGLLQIKEAYCPEIPYALGLTIQFGCSPLNLSLSFWEEPSCSFGLIYVIFYFFLVLSQFEFLSCPI